MNHGLALVDLRTRSIVSSLVLTLVDRILFALTAVPQSRVFGRSTNIDLLMSYMKGRETSYSRDPLFVP